MNTDNILLLGASGYMGQAFLRELKERQIQHMALYRKVRDYTNYSELLNILAYGHYDLVINAAAFIPKASVSLCDNNPTETIKANVIFPSMLAQACDTVGVPLVHLSTGCLWSDGQEHDEDDPPQRAFNGWCGFYVGTKVLAEQQLQQFERVYICRLRLPFDEFDSDRNYLSKLVHFQDIWCQTNSLSHRTDFVKAVFDLWQKRIPFGTYHLTNPGSINARDIALRMISAGIIRECPNMLDKRDGECVLSTDKLAAEGVTMRPIEAALTDAIENWVPRSIEQ